MVLVSFLYFLFSVFPANGEQQDALNQHLSPSSNGKNISSKTRGIVIVDKGNILSEPSNTSMIIDQLKLGTTVIIMEEK